MSETGDTCWGKTDSFSRRMEKNHKRSMGSISHKGRANSRFLYNSTIFRNSRNEGKCTKFKYYTRGGRKIIRKACDRACACFRDRTRFLFYIFSSDKKDRGTKTGHKLETSQQISPEETLQNGLHRESVKSSSKGRLGNIFRSEGCLPTHSSECKISKIPQILHSRQSLPVSVSMFRANNGSESLHKSASCSHSSFKNVKYQTSSLSRRLAGGQSMEATDPNRSRNDAQSPIEVRFHNQCKEIKSGTKPECSLHRSTLFPGQGDSVSNTRENCKNSESMSVVDNGQIGQKFPTFARLDGIMHTDSPIRTTIHETYPTTCTTALETVQNESSSINPCNKSVDRSFEMVDENRKSFKGKEFGSFSRLPGVNNRCIKTRLRCTSGRSVVSGRVEKARERLAHQQFRAGSSIFGNSTFSSPASGTKHFNSVRQYHGRAVCKQTRGDKISSIMPSSLETVDVSNRQRNAFKGRTCSGKIECISRQLEQGQNTADRVVFKTNCSKRNIQFVGNANDRPLCLRSKHETDNVLLLDSKSESNSNRCSDNPMGRDGSICLSSYMFNSSNSQSHAEIPVHSHSDSTIMAQTHMVHKTTANVHSKSDKVTSMSGPTVPTQNEHLSSKPSSVQVDGMEAVNRNFKDKGFSGNVRELLLASWRPGTQRDYTCKFNRFHSWCRGRQIDPFTASLNSCSDFLASLFQAGLGYRTIAGYRSMLSAILPPTESIKLGQHPVITRLLKGVFNSRPPKHMLVPEWDIVLVLKMLSEAPFEPLQDAALKYLTWKTVFLTAISTFRRCGDLQALRTDTGFMRDTEEGIHFIRDGLSKQDRPGHSGKVIFVPCFKSNELVDPRRSIRIYLDKTAGSRDSSVEDTSRLFLSICKPHRKVSKQTIASWIGNVIKMAYKNDKLKVKAHSTRAIGTSWALSKGASLSSILEAADWSSADTFVRFYYREMDSQVLSSNV